MLNLPKPSEMALRNLETELRLGALEGRLQSPPSVRYAETPQAAARAWREYTLAIYYKRLFRTSPV